MPCSCSLTLLHFKCTIKISLIQCNLFSVYIISLYKFLHVQFGSVVASFADIHDLSKHYHKLWHKWLNLYSVSVNLSAEILFILWKYWCNPTCSTNFSIPHEYCTCLNVHHYQHWYQHQQTFLFSFPGIGNAIGLKKKRCSPNDANDHLSRLRI